jgi:hypothetical protein
VTTWMILLWKHSERNVLTESSDFESSHYQSHIIQSWIPWDFCFRQTNSASRFSSESWTWFALWAWFPDVFSNCLEPFWRRQHFSDLNEKSTNRHHSGP